MKHIFNKTHTLVQPLFFAGMLLVLLPIFTVMTMERLERQDEFITQKMVGRGMALIRTLEAGTRTGMFTMQWGASRIQALLEEAASQPEVEYILIASDQGKILAHSQPDQVGLSFTDMPGIPPEKGPHYSMYHRVRHQAGKEDVFEVYKRFEPMRKPFARKSRREHGRHRSSRFDSKMAFECADDWSRCYFQEKQAPGLEKTGHYIFMGQSMKKGQALRKQLVRQTVFRTIILFFLGCAGLTALFAFQAYRNTKASLARVKAFSDDVIQNMPSGLATIDSNRNLTSMNHAARQIFGRDLVKPFPQWLDLMNQMDASHPIINREIMIKKETGEQIRIETTVSIIETGEDQENGFLFLFRDLSQIRELQEQVETNKRLAAIGKLAAGVAHEIRNPLSSIKGFATYFAKRYQENETDYQTAKIMEGEVERINRSITQLLEFAKPMAVELKKVNVRELIDHSLRLVEHDLTQKQIQTRVDIRIENEMITTDPDRMNQVFLNLYINAVHAMDKNGCLDVGVQHAPGPDPMIEIRIKDNGAGMDEADLERVFDPYYTTKSTGTGLGLSIVHRIIKNLGGRIRVESRAGQGASFIVCLPREEGLQAENKTNKQNG